MIKLTKSWYSNNQFIIVLHKYFNNPIKLFFVCSFFRYFSKNRRSICILMCVHIDWVCLIFELYYTQFLDRCFYVYNLSKNFITMSYTLKLFRANVSNIVSSLRLFSLFLISDTNQCKMMEYLSNNMYKSPKIQIAVETTRMPANRYCFGTFSPHGDTTH